MAARFAIAIGPLVVVVAAHGSGGALATVSVSLNRTTLPAIATILAVIAILNSASPEPHKATKPSRPHAAASATAGQVGVVEAFFTAINDRDWQRVWQLGGKNLGTGKYSTYHAMISGYRCTDRDVLVRQPHVERGGCVGLVPRVRGQWRRARRTALRVQLCSARQRDRIRTVSRERKPPAGMLNCLRPSAPALGGPRGTMTGEHLGNS